MALLERTHEYNSQTSLEDLLLREFYLVFEEKGQKMIKRYGYYAKGEDGWVLYRPKKSLFKVGEYVPDVEPGEIEWTSAIAARTFFNVMSWLACGKFHELSLEHVNQNTPCGVYFI